MADDRRLTAIGRGLAATLLVCAVPATARAADLTVELVGFGSDAGRAHFGLYDKEQGFATKAGRIAGTDTAIRGRRAVAVFGGLAPGRYAVIAFHDENGNGEFDRGLFGIPLEDFGFSNGARVSFGPPAFIDAAITLPAAGATITMRLD